MDVIRQIRKRDGRVVAFERRKIADAIFRAAQSVGGEDRFLAEQLAGVVAARVARRARGIPCIEEVQDAVEKVLIEAGHAQTAKTYILYRERRHQARAARGTEPSAAVAPLVGGEAPLTADGNDAPRDVAPIQRFSKTTLVEWIVDADGIAVEEAEDVARAVEQRLMGSGFARVSPDVLRTLARAELFERGVLSRLRAPESLQAPPGAAAEALRGVFPDLRARDPAVLSDGLGEAVLAQHLLRGVLPSAVSEAHRLGDLHLYDLGAPLRLMSIALDATTVATPALAGSHFSVGAGPARASAAIQETVLRYAPFAARLLTLEHANVFLAPYLGRLTDAALGEAVRGLLLAPAFAHHADRGGRLGVEWVLSPDVPRRLQLADVPEPGLPGTSMGDHADSAMRVTRAIVQELTGLRRAGHWPRLRFTIVLQRGRPWDAAMRALLRDALRCAAEGGEPRFVFDEPDDPSRGGRWLRRRVAQLPDPLRFERGDVSVASAVAVNLVAAALRTRGSGEDAFLREGERLAGLALDAAVVRRDLLDAVGEHPGEALYPLRRGNHPLVDIEGAFHLVEWVGVDAAIALLVPDDDRARRELRAVALSRFDEALQRLAAPRRLCVQSVEALAPEAASRFARADAERYPDTAGWWPDGMVPTYARDAAATTSNAGSVRGWVEPVVYETAHGGRVARRFRERVRADAPIDIENLFEALRVAERDASVREVVFDPWPRRMVRRSASTPRAPGFSGSGNPRS